MKYIFTHIVIAYCCLAAIHQLEAGDVGVRVELILDDIALSINGIHVKHIETKRTAVELACSLFCSWVAYTYMTKANYSPTVKIGIANAGAVIGSIGADCIFKDVSTKRIAYHIGAAAGRIVGTELGNHTRFIKDPAALGGKIGTIGVACYYQDMKRVKLYAASAIGEQLGMHLFDTHKDKTFHKVSTAGKTIGSSCGIALAAADTHTRHYFIKKALIDGVAMQAQRKMPTITKADPLFVHAAETCIVLTAATETLKQVA